MWYNARGPHLVLRKEPHAQSCPTLCYPMNRSTPGLPVHHQLSNFTQTHVHRPLGTPLGLAQRKRASPRGEAGTSGFLSVWDSDRRVPAELGQVPGKSHGPRSLQGYSPCQGIIPTQGSNPGLPDSRQILYYLRHQGSPKLVTQSLTSFWSLCTSSTCSQKDGGRMCSGLV